MLALSNLSFITIRRYGKILFTTLLDSATVSYQSLNPASLIHGLTFVFSLGS